MEKKTYTLEVDAQRVVELTEAEYAELEAEADACMETPAEYSGYVFMVPAKKPDGETIWLGFK